MAQTFYSREEAANVLGITPTELDSMHAANQVPGIGIGSGIKFRADDIHALAESRSAFDTSGSYSGEFSSEFGSEANALNESQIGSMDQSADYSASEFEESVETNSSSEFDLSGEIAPTQLSDPSVGSDLDIGMESGGLRNPSAIKLSAEDVPLSDSMDFGVPPPPSQVQKPPSSTKGSVLKLADDDALDFGGPTSPADSPLGAGPVSKAGTKARPQSDVKLDMETGSFEFSLTVDSSGKLGEAAGPISSPPSNIPRSFSGDRPPSSSKGLGEDSDVRLDFDAGAAPPDDDLIDLGDKPDSDIRIDPVSEVRSRGGMLGGGDLMATEQIDLDAELRDADAASLVKRPRSGGLPKTKATGPQDSAGSPTPTMLPTTSPFELSEDDLDIGSELGASGPGTSPLRADSALGESTGGSTAGASEFELTLAPEDEGPRTTPNRSSPSPLSYGDDEDIDLGGSPSIGIGDSASHRSELSGINLQVPADSGISLEKGMSGDDSVDFELTLDEEGVSGPKTLRGKLTDSDSEFELTLDEGSSASLPKIKKPSGLADDQKDIFETDFDLQTAGMEGDDSQSQAVALDEQDTDLESSDFDLALEEDQSSSGDMSRDEPMELSEDGSMDMSMDAASIDQMSDDQIVPADDEPAEEEEPAPLTIPAAHADWGMYPLIMMVPCVLIMFLALLMSYELVHNMWGYHQTSKPSGLLVESFAKLFEEEKVAPAPGGGGAKQ